MLILQLKNYDEHKNEEDFKNTFRSPLIEDNLKTTTENYDNTKMKTTKK